MLFHISCLRPVVVHSYFDPHNGSFYTNLYSFHITVDCMFISVPIGLHCSQMYVACNRYDYLFDFSNH